MPGAPFFWLEFVLTTPLPPIRLTILRAYLLILVVYAVAVAGLYLVATRYDAGIPPMILTRNYDSIRAAERMRRAWHAPWSAKTREDFNQSLRFAQSNVTEAGEAAHTLLVQVNQGIQPGVHGAVQSGQ